MKATEIVSPCKTEWQRKWLALDCHHQDLQKAADSVEAYCKRLAHCDRQKSLLVLAGNPGCGKTRLLKHIERYAHAIYMAVWEKHYWPKPLNNWSVSWPVVVDAFKEGNYSPMEELLRRDVVFIDDIGAEHDPSGNGVAKLCQIITTRERLFTVVTTNVPRAKWADTWDARVADRLYRNSKIIDLFSVPSFAIVQAERSSSKPPKKEQHGKEKKNSSWSR